MPAITFLSDRGTFRNVRGAFRNLHGWFRRVRKAIDYVTNQLQTVRAERQDGEDDGAPGDELSTLNELIESELVNLISLRDIAELEAAVPGFMDAVRQWVIDVDE